MFEYNVTIFHPERVCQEARQWSLENCGRYICSRYVLFEGEQGYGVPKYLKSNGSYSRDIDGISKFIFKFKYEEDAVYFKMVWG